MKKKTIMIHVSAALGCLMAASLVFGKLPPASKTNIIYDEIKQYMNTDIADQMLTELLEKNQVTTYEDFEETTKKLGNPTVYTEAELLTDPEKKCLDPMLPWNIGCIPVQRNFEPSYTPFVIKKEKISSEAAQKPDHQADEAAGIAIINANTIDDIFNIFKQFDRYEEIMSKFFIFTKELRAEELRSKLPEDEPLDEDLGEGTFYQASQIQLGDPKYQAHQTLRYKATRNDSDNVITIAWKADRRFPNDAGFRVFLYKEKKQTREGRRIVTKFVPIYDFETNEFTTHWLNNNRDVYFKTTEDFENWKNNYFKKNILENPSNKAAWMNGEYKLHNNQFGLQNVDNQSGYLKIIPYKKNQFLVLQHIYIRMDPSDPTYDFRNRGNTFEGQRTMTQSDFIKAEGSALRKELQQ